MSLCDPRNPTYSKDDIHMVSDAQVFEAYKDNFLCTDIRRGTCDMACGKKYKQRIINPLKLQN